MQTIKIICVGNLKEKYLVSAVEEYKKRLKSFCDFEIVEIAEQRLSENPSLSQKEIALQKEAEKIAEKIPKGSAVIAMAIEGKHFSSEELAEKISSFAVNGKSKIVFLIGSSFGLCEKLKQQSDLKLSMSKMTFPHQLARVMLCEQIYRAFGIINHTKYHK